MAKSSFSLSWDSHKNNICDGLSALQQNGEFVDMTLAADGHHVKVHQMIMALASPYIKELISSANCPHPVIFLNKMSHVTLRWILEYIYTGEVLIPIENLSELLNAAKELHIKGLEEMNLQESVTKYSTRGRSAVDEVIMGHSHPEDEICYFEIGSRAESPESKLNYTIIDEGSDETQSLPNRVEESNKEMDQDDQNNEPDIKKFRAQSTEPDATETSDSLPTIQYTVSNQGSLQMILNRYMYYLKHSNRNNTRQWRCVDYLNNIKCPAIVFTRKDIVSQRISAHTHAFHDKRILNKVRAGAIYTALRDAEAQGNVIKSKTRIKSEEK